MAAAQRRAEREAIRHQRELERQTKAEAKLEALQQAAHEVKVYENLMERLRSVHRDCGEAWDWNALAAKPEPKQPGPTSERERAAQLKLDGYEPNFLIKLLGLAKWRRRKLVGGVQTARQADAEENTKAEEEFRAKHAEWKETKELAERVLRGDTAAFREVLEEVDPFAEINELGSRIAFAFTNDGRATITLHVNGDTVIPSHVKTLLKNGTLSVKKMSQTQFYETYQDYVCGAAFRVVRELFALLPLETIIVTAVSNMLDTSSGHMKDQPILSVMMPRDTIEKLNFEKLDPSDALRNFVHHMEFKKNKGFSPVESLRIDMACV